MEAEPIVPPYPLRLSIDYPDRKLNRVTSFFRIIWALPILVVLVSVSGVVVNNEWERGKDYVEATATAGGILFFAPLLLILFRRKYPRWWFDWNLNLTRFENRVAAYVFLMDDRYPSTDEEQSVHIEIDYPDAQRDLNRFLPLVKWILAIPHYIVLLVLFIVALVAVILAWIAILFTGKYPRGLFEFVEGTLRWGLRAQGYMLLLVTDRYPPFSLEP